MRPGCESEARSMPLPRLRRAFLSLALLGGLGLLAASLGAARAAEELPRLGVTLPATSVSGLSSGAYMAGQIELAHSKDIVGAGVVAGGPFACAEISLEEARRRIAYGLGGLVVGWQTICPRCVHTLSSSHGFRPSHRSQSSAVGNDWMRSCIVATRCAVCRLANLAACRSRHRRTRSASVIARSPIGFRPMSSSFP
jgi:hypothetical protein